MAWAFGSSTSVVPYPEMSCSGPIYSLPARHTSIVDVRPLHGHTEYPEEYPISAKRSTANTSMIQKKTRQDKQKSTKPQRIPLSLAPLLPTAPHLHQPTGVRGRDRVWRTIKVPQQTRAVDDTPQAQLGTRPEGSGGSSVGDDQSGWVSPQSLIHVSC